MKYLPGAMLELNRKAVLLISGPLPKTAALGWGLTPATVGSYCPGPTRLFLSPVKIVPSGGGCACNCPSGVSSYLRVADTGLGFQTLLRVSDTDLGFHTQTWVSDVHLGTVPLQTQQMSQQEACALAWMSCAPPLFVTWQQPSGIACNLF